MRISYFLIILFLLSAFLILPSTAKAFNYIASTPCEGPKQGDDWVPSQNKYPNDQFNCPSSQSSYTSPYIYACSSNSTNAECSLASKPSVLYKCTGVEPTGSGNLFVGCTSGEDTTPPTSVYGHLNVISVSDTQIDIAWTPSTDNVGIVKYVVSIYIGDTFLSTVDVLPPKTAYSHPNLSPDTTYWYFVRAYDAAGNFSDWPGPAVSRTTLPASSPVIYLKDAISPSVPASLAATPVSSSQINLTWGASTDTGGAGLLGYSIYRCSGADCTNFAQVATVSTNAYSGTGLSNSITYSYYVTAYDGVGNSSAQSNTMQAATLVPPDTQAPTGVVVTATPVSPTQIDLSWTASTDNVGVVRYEIQRYRLPDYTDLDTISVSPLPRYYQHTGLLPGTTYDYRILAYDAAGNHSNAAYATATTPTIIVDTTPPSTPGSLTATTVSSSQINLSWMASTDTGGSGLAGYRVYRCQSSGCTNFTNNATLGPGTTSYSDTGLTPATSYRYYIEAFDGSGNTAQSSIAEATTQAQAPPDTTAPDTSVTSHPNNPTNSTSAGFGFTSTETGSTFECQMDSGGYSACTAPKPYMGLTEGSHTFYVKAIDQAGNMDPTPASYTWTVSAASTESAIPDITVSPITLPFGNVNVDASSERTVSVRNDGNGNLAISAITDPGSPFSKVSDNCSGQTLSSAAGCTITIRFSPKTTESFTSSFNIPSNDPDENPVTISLAGTGTNAGSPDITILPSLALSFPNISAGVTADQTITVKNEGSADLIISGITTPAIPFSVVTGADNCSNHALIPGQSCTVTVRFTSTASGSFTSSFNIPSNDPDENSVTLSLSGSATPGTNNPPTKPALAFPANSAAGMPTTLTLQWENSTDADGDPVAYKLYIGTDPTFAGVNPMTIASVPKNNNFSTAFRYSMGIIGLFGVIAMGGVSRNRKKISLLMIPVILLAGFVLTSCGSSEVGNNKSSNNNNKNYESYTVNLKPNTTYYWKVAVDDGKGGVTESDTYSFITGQ